MPSVVIETRTTRTPEQETAVMQAVHAALVDAFQIPVTDGELRLVAHAPHRMNCPPNRAQPAMFTIVSIDAFAGRSLDAKRTLYKGIVDRLEPLGIPRDHVLTVLREHPLENWGVRGGHAACDVNLGFRLDV